MQIRPEVMTECFDLTVRGSGYAESAWNILNQCAIEGRDLTDEEVEEFDDLMDSARDDLEGPRLAVDLGKDKIYA